MEGGGARGRGGFRKYPDKAAIVRRQIGERRYDVLRQRLRGSGPDLFLYNPRSGRYWFAEVKKIGDRVNSNQLRDFRMIERLLQVPVQLVRVHPR